MRIKTFIISPQNFWNPDFFKENIRKRFGKIERILLLRSWLATANGLERFCLESNHDITLVLVLLQFEID